MPDKLLLYESKDGIATVTLNEPQKLNPFSIRLQRRLRAALALIRADRSVRVLVITGAGKAFSVGADLRGLEGDAAAEGKSRGTWVGDMLAEVTLPLLAELRELRVPTIAAVNGAVAGGSVGLALACDLVVAARSAYFYLPFAPQLGIIPDAGATWFLPRLVGSARALGLALLGDRLPAERAAAWGLVWACVDDEALQPTVRQLAQRLAALPAHAALEVRRAFRASLRNDLDTQLEYEAARQRELIDREAFAEGTRAFLARRPPVFGDAT
jgi:2-(1,2-epoxy-1,2-dihydrophenyl)acetyl-CoA isomerase